MKNIHLTISVASLIAIGVAAYFIRNKLSAAGTQDTKGVTATGTAGIAQGEATITTPINSGNVAYVADRNAFQLLEQAGGKILQRAASLVLPSQGDKLQAYGNPVSAKAAATAPLRTQYKPSSYASF